MDTTRQSKKDPMHTVDLMISACHDRPRVWSGSDRVAFVVQIEGNVKMCFGLALDVGKWSFTEKRRKAEARCGSMCGCEIAWPRVPCVLYILGRFMHLLHEDGADAPIAPWQASEAGSMTICRAVRALKWPQGMCIIQ
jgi:hypothetical protein